MATASVWARFTESGLSGALVAHKPGKGSTATLFERCGGEVDLEGVFLTHAAGGDVELELSEESNGTKKLLSLVPHVADALEQGTLIVSDQMDVKLHPKLLRYVIWLFTDPKPT